MMNNLFMIFDPSTSMNFSMNWLTLIMWIMIMPYIFWVSSSVFSISWKKLLKIFFKKLKMILNLSNQKMV